MSYSTISKTEVEGLDILRNTIRSLQRRFVILKKSKFSPWGYDSK
jgi:hypothetical protein